MQVTRVPVHKSCKATTLDRLPSHRLIRKETLYGLRQTWSRLSGTTENILSHLLRAPINRCYCCYTSSGSVPAWQKLNDILRRKKLYCGHFQASTHRKCFMKITACKETSQLSRGRIPSSSVLVKFTTTLDTTPYKKPSMMCWLQFFMQWAFIERPPQERSGGEVRSEESLSNPV